MTPMWKLFCIPAAAAVGAGAYVASDREVLRQIGLEPVGRGLSEIRHHVPRALGGRPRIRQGGPVCFEVLLWPADGGPLRPLPSAHYSGPLVLPGYGAGIPMAVGGYGSPLDGRDFAALVTPGISVVPPGDVIVVVPPGPTTETSPVSVPEPPSIAILAAALVLLIIIRRYRHV